MDQLRIGVIGGGAAGMMAAITAAQEGAKVTLLEGGERVGKKILATGNGKCNLSNRSLSARDYYGAKTNWIEECLARFGTLDSIRFFEGIGLLIKDKNGYLYPMSEQASSVLDVLRTRLRTAGVELVTQAKVTEIRPGKGGNFQVLAGEHTYRFDRVILACGSKAAPKTGSDGSGYTLAQKLGHRIIPVIPALVQLKCRESYLKEVAGVRAEALVRITAGDKRIEERGELQLTDYGISGIPVFQLSREVNYILSGYHKTKTVSVGSDNAEIAVRIDLLPEYDAKALDALFADRMAQTTDQSVEEFFTGILNKKLMLLFIKLAGLKREMSAASADRRKLKQVLAMCKDFELHITGSNSFDNAQVCAGGVDTAQVTTGMESELVPGLYFAGEILDVDGRCGGYNLQWAWCSGFIAGTQAAQAAYTALKKKP